MKYKAKVISRSGQNKMMVVFTRPSFIKDGKVVPAESHTRHLQKKNNSWVGVSLPRPTGHPYRRIEDGNGYPSITHIVEEPKEVRRYDHEKEENVWETVWEKVKVVPFQNYDSYFQGLVATPVAA